MSGKLILVIKFHCKFDSPLLDSIKSLYHGNVQKKPRGITSKIIQNMRGVASNSSSVSSSGGSATSNLKFIPSKKIKTTKNVGSAVVDKPILKNEPRGDNLSVLEQAIAQAEQADQKIKTQFNQQQASLTQGAVSQALPGAVLQNTNTLNPNHSVAGGIKEAPDAAGASGIEAGGNTQYVEIEPNPEIPPEVETYLQRVENHHENAPEEIVVADGSFSAPTSHNYPSKPVVVLPITPEIDKKGAHKSSKLSVRWLVEWSHKVMKMFFGKVIYREVEG